MYCSKPPANVPLGGSGGADDDTLRNVKSLDHEKSDMEVCHSVSLEFMAQYLRKDDICLSMDISLFIFLSFFLSLSLSLSLPLSLSLSLSLSCMNLLDFQKPLTPNRGSPSK